MRIVSIIVIILLLAALITPFWFGKKAEEEYNNLLDAVSEIENLEVVSRTYNRGWLNSTAQVTYLFNLTDEDNIEVLLDDTIYHGPIPIGLFGKGKIMLKPVMAVIESNANINSKTKSEHSEILNALPDLNIETVIDLSGAGTYETNFPELDLTVEENRTIKWSGMDGLGSFTLSPRKTSSAFNSEEFVVEDDKAIVSIKDINLESDLFYPTSNFKNPLGSMTLNIGELSSKGKNTDGPNKVVIRNFDIIASTNQKAELLNHSHSIGFKELEVGGNTYGPGLYELEIRNIDKQVLEQIQLTIQESYSNTVDNPESSETIIAEFMKVLPKLIEKSPEIELTKLSIKTNEGEISGHALISASGNSMDNPELAANPIFLLAAISAEANLSVSKPLLDNLLKDYKIEEISDEITANNEELPSEEELQALGSQRAQSEIKEMLDQQVLVLKDGNYHLQATYSLGQITLNGNPLDLGAIMNQL